MAKNTGIPLWSEYNMGTLPLIMDRLESDLGTELSYLMHIYTDKDMVLVDLI